MTHAVPGPHRLRIAGHPGHVQQVVPDSTAGRLRHHGIPSRVRPQEYHHPVGGKAKRPGVVATDQVDPRIGAKRIQLTTSADILSPQPTPGYAGRRMPDPNRGQPAASADVSGRRSESGASGLRRLGARTFFRQRDAAAVGVHSRALRRLVEDGAVERVTRGLYRVAEAEPTEHYTLAAVCARVPGAIVCLLSALSVHELTHASCVAGVDRHPAQGPHAPPARAAGPGGALLRRGGCATVS